MTAVSRVARRSASPASGLRSISNGLRQSPPTKRPDQDKSLGFEPDILHQVYPAKSTTSTRRQQRQAGSKLSSLVWSATLLLLLQSSARASCLPRASRLPRAS